VQDLTLSIPPGEAFALLGPNGAGKTTTVKMLLDFVRPSAGAARLDGRPASDPLSRRNVGYLPENPVIPGHLTGAEYLTLHGGLHGKRGTDLKERVWASLARVKLQDEGNMATGKYSKGMAQRLGLAAALLAGPRVLILDEPTSGLDPRGIHEVRVLLEELKAAGVTIFLNSHFLSEVEKLCTTVAIIDKGRLVAHDTLANLCREGETLEQVFLRVVPGE
jgi:ABC-2 type transport system ATP-binding protein